MSKINVYVCCQCGFEIITKDTEPRTVTPMFITCPECCSQANSSFYTNSQDLIPNYEWFIPKTIQELKEACLHLYGDVFSEKEYEEMLNGSVMYRKIK